ncbi:PIN domain-containing protein [Methylibium sp.]|uniref:PIN domain-containing protein n=1 Tax=Methylibium sp. TaxID=2067992 RepID=UPI0025F6988D|nr:PIN domain-containing protein [Methylibium sp.]
MQPPDFDLLRQGSFKIKVFLAAHQSRLPRDLVKSLQAFGDRAEYIDLEVQGKNALDFHIAYVIGRLSASEPDAYVHVISRDEDIELLFPHLRAGKINIGRYERIADIPLLKPLPASQEEKMQLVAGHLERLGGKPRTLKALEATIGSVFRRGLPVENVALLVKRLELEGYARVVGSKVEYGLPLAWGQHRGKTWISESKANGHWSARAARAWAKAARRRWPVRASTWSSWRGAVRRWRRRRPSCVP